MTFKSTKNLSLAMSKKKSHSFRRFALLPFSLFISSLITTSSAVAVDSNSDNVDDDLVVSFAASGAQSFPDTDAGQTDTVAAISFNTSGTPAYTAAGLTNGTNVSAVNIRSGNTVTIGTGAGNLSLINASVWGGAGNGTTGTGQYAMPGGTNQRWTLTFTNTQRYIGFWWSAGNNDNNVQLRTAAGANLLSPAFTTASLNSALLNGNSCPASAPTAAQETANPWMEYCGNPNSSYAYVNEPYAFIHLRYETGFRQVQFWGTGFEFDNLTFSETVPTFGDSEEVVGNPDVDSNWPDVLAIDPRATGITLPTLALSDANNATICLRQVDQSGAALSTPTIRVTRTTSVTGVTAHTAETNRWGYSGTRAQIQDQIPSLRVESSNGTNALVSSGSIRVRMILTNGTTMASCDTPQINQVIEIRSIGITGRKQVGLGP